jgi:hypothetical protein
VPTGGCAGVGGPGGGSCGGAATDRTAESWSFASTRSFDAVVTLAVLVSDSPPALASTVAVTRISVVAPAASSSSVQVTVRPETEHSPSSAWGGDDTRRPAGSRSVVTTARAVDGPALDTWSV